MDSENENESELLPPIDAAEHSCRACVFYDFPDDRVQDANGICRRHAPHPALVPDDASDTAYFAEWPVVAWNDWCGEWQPFADGEEKEPTAEV